MDGQGLMAGQTVATTEEAARDIQAFVQMVAFVSLFCQ